MVNLFARVIIPEHILEMQNLQYSEKVLLEDTVPASTEKPGQVNVSSLGHFYCWYITGSFTTLYLDGEEVKDNGVNYLRGQLYDGATSRALFNDYIPLDLIFTPGRVKSALSTTVLTDPSGNSLFYPQNFQYMFPVNGIIIMKVKNDSNYANSYKMVFHGVRLPEQAVDRRLKLNREIQAKMALRKEMTATAPRAPIARPVARRPKA